MSILIPRMVGNNFLNLPMVPTSNSRPQYPGADRLRLSLCIYRGIEGPEISIMDPLQYFTKFQLQGTSTTVTVPAEALQDQV